MEHTTAVSLKPEDGERLRQVMEGSEVDIHLDLKSGVGSGEIYFSDLGHEYVTINAEYHT